MTDDRTALLHGMLAAPDDEAPRRVFADWLLETDDDRDARLGEMLIRWMVGYYKISEFGHLIWKFSEVAVGLRLGVVERRHLRCEACGSHYDLQRNRKLQKWLCIPCSDKARIDQLADEEGE